MQSAQQGIEIVRGQIFSIMLGTIFLFVGAIALAISAVRYRKGVRILTWFGLFSGCYGSRLLFESDAFTGVLPLVFTTWRPYVIALITYLILVPGLLVWYELTTGWIRQLVKMLVAATVIIAAFGIASFVTGSGDAFLRANSVMAIVFTAVLVLVNLVPSLARRYLIFQSPVLAIGSLVLGVTALEVNLANFLPFRRLGSFEPIAFGLFVLSIGYVAVEHVLLNERRLLSIEQELEVAREIQKSILPASEPQMTGLDIAAAYHPMASVAGDFYEFIPIDQHRAGFFIADVSGHGVPAALIASMIKVAMHAVQSSAHSPSELLRELNRILSQQLNGQFVTAGYLFLDLQSRVARYSGAGHPPLLHWNTRASEIRRVESNGLLFGILSETEYPALEFPLSPGDRFLMYTDGLTEPENSFGEPFGERRIVHVLERESSHGAAHLSKALCRESSSWQPPNTPQQDDVTLIVLAIQ